MKNNIFGCILLAVSVLGLHSCASSTNEAIVYDKNSSAVNSSEASIEREILAQTNRLRTSKGLKPVALHKGLSNVAREHSDFMSKNSGKFKLLGSTISHFGFKGRDKIVGRQFDLSNMGENVVSTDVVSNVASEMMRAWMDSPSHYNVLVGTTYRFMGMGVRKRNARTHGTMLMAVPSIGRLPQFVGPKGF